MCARGNLTQHGKPQSVRVGTFNRMLARAQAGPAGVADRLVILLKPRNGGGGKKPEFKMNA
jgi:hypothetical protein